VLCSSDRTTILISLAGWAMLSAPARGEVTIKPTDTRTVHVRQTALVRDEDQRVARDEAKKEAITEGVENIVKRKVGSPQRAHVIIEGAEQYAIIRPGSERVSVRDGVLQYEADLTLDLKKIEGELGKGGNNRNCRVMVLIPEQHLRGRIPDPAAETEVENQFIDAGFAVIDRGRFAELRKEDQERLAAKLKDPAKVAAIGRRFGADVLITGEAFSQLVGPVQQFVSCRAHVELRALKVDTAELLIADHNDASGADLTEEIAAKKALRDTARLLAPSFVKRISSVCGSVLQKIQVQVIGLDKLSEAARLEELVRKFPGVNDVHRIGFDEAGLEIEVDVDKVSAEQVAERLDAISELPPYTFDSTFASPTRVKVAARKQ
jgi:hypothetical protein